MIVQSLNKSMAYLPDSLYSWYNVGLEYYHAMKLRVNGIVKWVLFVYFLVLFCCTLDY